jgi:hypothetical protein
MDGNTAAIQPETEEVSTAESETLVTPTGLFAEKLHGYDLITSSATAPTLETELVSFNAFKILCHNKLEFHYNLSDKKLLFSNLKRYYELMGRDPWKYMPLTYHIEKGTDDAVFHTFL